MWRLLGTSYGEYFDPEESCFLPLDHVEVAASFQWKELPEKYNFTRFALNILRGDVAAILSGQHVNKFPRSSTNAGYLSHLQHLENWKVLESVADARDCYYFCNYFAVAKDDTVSRSIFNGHRLGF